MHAKLVEIYTSAAHRSGLSGPPRYLKTSNAWSDQNSLKILHGKMLNEKPLDIVKKPKRSIYHQKTFDFTQ
jgi:hypothetical protein